MLLQRVHLRGTCPCGAEACSADNEHFEPRTQPGLHEIPWAVRPLRASRARDYRETRSGVGTLKVRLRPATRRYILQTSGTSFLASFRPTCTFRSAKSQGNGGICLMAGTCFN